VSNLLVEFGSTDEIDHLRLPEAQGGVERFLNSGAPASRANSIGALATELLPTTKTVSQFSGCDDFGSHELGYSLSVVCWIHAHIFRVSIVAGSAPHDYVIG
jgi:hypothetical protein